MAGRGPAPKPDEKRARTNADTIPKTELPFKPTKAPALPTDVGIDWHVLTQKWWTTWASSPQAAGFTETDWSFLLDTALMHHAMWSKQQWTLAAEVRLRVSKFGATPEDRARLRMVFADPEKTTAGESDQPKKSSSRQRYGDLQAVPDAV